MSQESRVEELLLVWHDEAKKGNDPDPQELCQDCPELASELGRRIRVLKKMGKFAEQVQADLPTSHQGRPVPSPKDSVSTLRLSREPDSLRKPRLSKPTPNRVGRYDVLGEVARGGMGVIWRVHDLDFDRHLAMKVLLQADAGNSIAEERFWIEARIAGQLQHPGVPPVHELGRLPDGRPFFTMKLIEGEPLAKLLEDDRKLSTDSLAHWLSVFEQICQAVAYAHSKNIIHRDLKPLNVMVGAFGEVQVMDWGLAKVLTDAEEDSTTATKAPTLADSEKSKEWRSLSQTGDIIGTPCYMAPEQARGEIGDLDARADVFGLGAILCEILTGDPPFSKPSAFETAMQAASGDLSEAFEKLQKCGVNPALLDLAKSWLAPAKDDRPADAGEVAKRVTAYLESVQDRLRRAEIEAAEAAARAESERKRRRTTLVLAFVAFLLFGGIGIGGFAAWRQSVLEETRYTAGIDRVYQLLKKYRYKEAKETSGELTATLGFWVPQKVRERLERVQIDSELLTALDRVKQDKVAIVHGMSYGHRRAADGYDKAFRTLAEKENLSRNDGDFESSLVQWVKDRHPVVQEQVVAALDDLAACLTTTNQPKRKRAVLAAIRQIDQNPIRNQLRQPQVWENPQKLAAVLAKLDLATVSPQSLVSTSFKIQSAKGNRAALEFLDRVQVHHPSDYWLLGRFADLYLVMKEYDSAIASFRAVSAVRPDSVSAYTNWGIALASKKDYDGAIAKFKIARNLDPNSALVYNNWGLVLSYKKDYKGAIAKYKKATSASPTLTVAYCNWGDTLQSMKDYSGAIAKFQKAANLDPKHATAYARWGTILGYNKKDYDGAIAKFQKATKLDPKHAEAYENWGVALLNKGDYDGAIAKFQKAATLDPGNARIYSNWGGSLASKKDYDGAIAKLKIATQIDPSYAQAYFNLGLAFYRRERLEAAINAFKKAIQSDPKLIKPYLGWGRALTDTGQFQEGIEVLRTVKRVAPANHPLQPDVRNLIQKCQQLLALERQLPKVLSGEQIVPINEELKLINLCVQYKKRYWAAVKLCVGIFNRNPALAHDLKVQHRYNAACFALLASAGKGKQATEIDATERIRLRQQALSWLQADLAAYRKVLKNNRFISGAVFDRLRYWQSDPDLTPVRDLNDSVQLPKEEQPAWSKLWSDVHAMSKRARTYFTETRTKGTLKVGAENTHGHKMIKSCTYVIEMRSQQFDTYLFLHDSEGNKLHENDDIHKGNRNSRIQFTPKTTGNYRIVATSYRHQGQGAYEIIIREFGPPNSEKTGSATKP
ncbi:MAG: tetratricopeptide repeat protein [Gemmataceae bacterium]